MVEKLSGVYTTSDIGGFTPDQAIARGAIGVVGHMRSGTNVVNGDKFSTLNPFGTIFEFTSIVEAKATLGDANTVSVTGWVDGTFGSGATSGVAGYDTDSNLIRALELVYLGNPRAKIYAAVLSGVGTDPSTIPDGTAEALAELIKIDDIEFITPAGLEYNATYLTHATASDDDDNQAERIYVGGVSLNDAYSGSTDINKQDTFDVSAYTTLAESDGRSVLVIGNGEFEFQTGFRSGVAVEPELLKEIGGNWIANFLAGYLSSFSEQISLLNKGVVGFLPVYNGKPKIWSSTELKTNFDNSHVSIRFSASNSPSYFFEKAMTHSPKVSAWGKITRRRIIDRVIKDVRVVLKAEVGKSNIQTRRRAINDRVRSKLIDLLEAGLIQGTVSSNVFVQTGDPANGVLRANVIVTPVGEIEEVRLTVGVIV